MKSDHLILLLFHKDVLICVLLNYKDEVSCNDIIYMKVEYCKIQKEFWLDDSINIIIYIYTGVILIYSGLFTSIFSLKSIHLLE